MWIDHELRGYLQRSQRMPPLDRLLHWHLSVAITHQDQRRRAHVLHEMHWITLGINGRVIVNGGAEKRDHPLVDLIDPVITEHIGQAGASNRCRKTMRLGLSPHRHVAAIAVTTYSEASGVDRIFLQEGVH